jgi:hypothetical protein
MLAKGEDGFQQGLLPRICVVAQDLLERVKM